MRTAAAVLLSWTFKEGRVCGFWDLFFFGFWSVRPGVQ